MSSIQWTDETWLVGKSWWSNGDVGVGGGPMLDWIVIGGESGAGARPFDVAWARKVILDCRDRADLIGPAVFVKQLGSMPHASGFSLQCVSSSGGDPEEWPEDLRVQEWPCEKS